MARRVKQIMDKEIVARAKGDLPELPGQVFSWQNPYTNEKMGWRIWSPVLRDSDIGLKVAEQLGDTFDKFKGLNEETNYFMKGRDCMLAFTSKERYDEAQAEKQERADAQLRQIDDAAELRRNVMIQTPMGNSK